MGQNNGYLIKCDASGKMDPQELRKKVEEVNQKEQIPIMVCATGNSIQSYVNMINRPKINDS